MIEQSRKDNHVVRNNESVRDSSSPEPTGEDARWERTYDLLWGGLTSRFRLALEIANEELNESRSRR